MSKKSKIFIKNYSDFSYEEIVEFLKKNNLNNYKKYKEFCINCAGKIDNKQLPKNPWELASEKIPCVEFFNFVFPDRKKSNYVKKQRLSMQEHIDIIKDNNLFTIKHYQAFFEANKNKIDGLYSSPWIKFNMTAWDFFDFCIPNRIQVKKENKYYEISEEEVLAVIEKNSLYSSRKYRSFYLKNKESIPLPSRPWDRFNMKESDFFDKYFPKRIKISSLEEIKIIFKENNIVSEKLFKKHVENNPEHNIQLSFHKCNNIKFSEFLDSVWGQGREKHREVMSLNDFINLLKENKIFSFNQYKKYYQENKNVRTNLPSAPMVSYKLTQPEIFKMAFPICSKLPSGRLHFKTKRKDVILFLSQNNIETIFQYKEIEKELPVLKDILKTNDDNLNQLLEEVASLKK
jgi:hypothetical protein